jgi:Ca-activated chloride channel family protein
LIGYDDSATAPLGADYGQEIARDVAAGHAVTALYEVVPAEIAERLPRKGPPAKPHRPIPRDVTAADRSRETLTVRLEYRQPETGKDGMIEYAATDSGRSFTAATTDFRFAAAVASFGMILRRSQYSGSMTLRTVGEIAAAACGEDRGGARARFLELVAKAQELGVGR